MNSAQINAIIVEKMTAVCGPYDSIHPEVNKNYAQNNASNPEAYPLGGEINWSYIDCEKSADLLAFCLQHPEFSHFSHRNRYSVTIYWHHDTAPNRVISIGSFDPSRMQEAHKVIGDEIGAATAWASGY